MTIKRKWRTLLRPYQGLLRRYVEHGSGAALTAAQRLGRRAVALGLETLDMALIHEQALLDHVLPIGDSAARDRIVKRARTFFAEAILPIEESHRSAQEANVHLSRLNRALSRRTTDLVSSNRELKEEVTRRHHVEETLRRSEQHSNRLLEQSQRLQEQLRLLSRQILSAQEEERKRISRELHDVIAQMLTGINVRLAALKVESMANTKGLGRKISRTQQLVQRSVDIVHRFALDLRPAMLDDLGLIPALHSFMKRYAKETGIRVRLTAFAGVEDLDSAKRTALYRVAQEALTNIARHAQATQADVIIQRLPSAVRMQIKDNGKSFDVERVLHGRKGHRLGLVSMRERVEMVGGTFTLESAPGRGTTVQAQLPFPNRAKEHSRP